MAFNLTPESLALMTGGLNMMAASRGGNTDLTKGGLGYSLQQGLQGGLQGLQLGNQMQSQKEKRDRMNELLNGLGTSQTFSALPPEQQAMVKMALQNGDMKTAASLISPAGPKPTSLMQNAQAAGLQPGTTKYNKFIHDAVMKPNTVVNMPGQIKAPPGFMIDPKNPTRVTRIPGAEFSQAQMKAAGFANRMSNAEVKMTSLTDEGYDPSNVRDKGSDYIPVIGNFIKSEEGQKYTQAQEDWVRAKLRLESGAVIGEEEMAREISTYFPMPGDTVGVMQQKAKAREEAMQNLIAESQGAFESMLSKKPKNESTNKNDDPLSIR